MTTRIRFSRLLRAVCVCCLAIGVAYSVLLVARVLTVRAQSLITVGAQPYILEQWFISYTTDPKGKVETIRLIEGRADGSTVVKILQPQGDWITPYRTISFPDRTVYVSDHNQIRSTKYLKPVEVATFKRQLTSRTCGGTRVSLETFQGSEIHNGVNVEKWKRGEADSAGNMMRTTTYRAPALGCLEVEEQFEHQDKTMAAMSMLKWEDRIHSISLTEPPAADFDPGTGYQEVRPSAFNIATNVHVALFFDEARDPGLCDAATCASARELTASLLKADQDYVDRVSKYGKH